MCKDRKINGCLCVDIDVSELPFYTVCAPNHDLILNALMSYVENKTEYQTKVTVMLAFSLIIF